MLVGNGQIVGAREVQEDYFAHFETNDFQVLIVADGIGGREQGEVASELAVSNVARCLRESDLTDVQATLMLAVDKANAAIEAESHGSYDEGMGTTLIVALISPERIVWISVGDSLLYRLREGVLSQLNASHTHANMLDQLVANGELSAAEAAEDPDRESITSALMGVPIPLIDCRDELRLPGDRFLIASDGILTIGRDEMTSVIGTDSDPQLMVDDLLAKVTARQLPSQDNCTVMVAVEQKERRTRLWIWVACLSAVCLLLAGAAVYYWQNVRDVNEQTQEITETPEQSPPEVESVPPTVPETEEPPPPGNEMPPGEEVDLPEPSDSVDAPSVEPEVETVLPTVPDTDIEEPSIEEPSLPDNEAPPSEEVDMPESSDDSIVTPSVETQVDTEIETRSVKDTEPVKQQPPVPENPLEPVNNGDSTSSPDDDLTATQPDVSEVSESAEKSEVDNGSEDNANKAENDKTYSAETPSVEVQSEPVGDEVNAPAGSTAGQKK